MDDSTTLIRTPGVLEAEVDGDRVLMHPEDFNYFELSTTGAAVWERIDDRRTIGAIVTELSTSYDADAATIRDDVLEFAGNLLAHRLVTTA